LRVRKSEYIRDTALSRWNSILSNREQSQRYGATLKPLDNPIKAFPWRMYVPFGVLSFHSVSVLSLSLSLSCHPLSSRIPFSYFSFSRSISVTVVSSRFHQCSHSCAPSLQIVVSEVRPRGLASKWWQFAAGDKGDKGDTVVAQAWYQLSPTSRVTSVTRRPPPEVLSP